MPTADLDDAVREYYGAHELAPETVGRWVREAPPPRRRPILAAAVAVAALGGMLSLTRSGSTSRLEVNVAQDVWHHHTHPEAPEVRIATLTQLGPSLARITFPTPSPARLGRFETVGGRHCTLLGQLAARANLIDAEGGAHTLYVTDASPRFAELKDVRIPFNAGEVEMWRESGLVFARAGPPHAP